MSTDVDISLTTGELFYSGSWHDIKNVLKVLNIGEGKMATITQTMVNEYQEMIDREIDALLSETYQVPIRAYNQTQIAISSQFGVPSKSETGSQAIPAGAEVVTISGQQWDFKPVFILVSVSMPTGGQAITAIVDKDTVTSQGFTVSLTAVPPTEGYILSYTVSTSYIPGASFTGLGKGVRVFPGDVRMAARYWTAGQILTNEFQQLESNLTEQATLMISTAKMDVFNFSRPTHRIPGQRRKSNLSKTMSPNMQPSSIPERPV